METTPLFIADLTPLKKPVVRLALSSPKFGAFFIMKTDSLTDAQTLAETLNGAVASIMTVDHAFPSESL